MSVPRGLRRDFNESTCFGVGQCIVDLGCMHALMQCDLGMSAALEILNKHPTKYFHLFLTCNIGSECEPVCGKSLCARVKCENKGQRTRR